MAIEDYNDIKGIYVIEFSKFFTVIFKENEAIDEINSVMEATISRLIFCRMKYLISEMDNEAKNNFINKWFKSSNNKKIKDILMVILDEALKIHKFNANNNTCKKLFKNFCNNKLGHFKKNFSFYENIINENIINEMLTA